MVLPSQNVLKGNWVFEKGVRSVAKHSFEKVGSVLSNDNLQINVKVLRSELSQ